MCKNENRFFKNKFSHSENTAFRKYNGKRIPFGDEHFDYAVSVDVIEHVRDYKRFIQEMMRVSKKGIFISTPMRRPENTRENGKPVNIWHLREWSFDEFNFILDEIGLKKVNWHFINGKYEGPFSVSDIPEPETQAISSFIHKLNGYSS